ncbi:Ig-like domain-containing protein, partial [Pseudomonas sp. SED1]|uniref:Ig-like domain-containing protein n=1 Tax=Pseudomonas sp. SED1 TaxID=3056845 RepID=UPI00296ED264
ITDPIVSGDITDDNTPTFVGSAELGATVEIWDGAILIGTADVQPDGTWEYTPSPPLTEGPHSLSTIVVDAAGNRSPQTAPIDFTVDTSAVVISISHATDDVGPVTTDLVNNGVTDDTTPTLHGRGTPGGTVNIYLDNVLHGTAPVSAAGTWVYPVAPALAEGNYVFTASVTTAAGGE